MYGSKYSQVSRYSPEAQKKMPYRSKGKSCGYYMRIVFFFSSLIQSLIIVSLVLFLIYGKNQDSASTSSIHEMEESFSRLSIENMALKQQRKNLTNLLNATLIQKARNDWDLSLLRHASNISAIMILDMDRRLTQCNRELAMCRFSRNTNCLNTLPTPENCNCGVLVERLTANLKLVQSNFTQTTQRMRMEMDLIAKERDNINLEAIRLRRDKSTHEKEIQFFRQKCKDDFAQSLSGISSVSSTFLLKIDSLFPTHIPFQLTCPKQREHLEQIRTNCSSLSREVEDRFQRYLNSVGDQVTNIQSESSRLKAENWRLSEDFRWCSQNRTSLIQLHKQNLDKLQLKHDHDKETLLMDKIKLNGEIEVLENNVKYKTKEVEHLLEQIKFLNMSCMTKPGFGGSMLGVGGPNPSQFGSFGSGFSRQASGFGSNSGSLAFNKPGSTGTGSSSTSLFSSGSSGSTGFGSNKPGSTGTGSSSTSLFSSGSSSSTGFGSNKPGSTGTGSSSTSLFSSGSSSSTGFGSNKPGLTGTGSTSFGSAGSNPSLTASGRSSSGFGSSPGSTGSSPNLSSGGLGSNKPTPNGKSSSGLGSTSSASSGSTGSTSKSSSSSWFSFGSSSSGQSKPGSGTGKGTPSGTGSSFGAGRTSGLGGGSVSVAQHLQDLQRLINPPGPEEKQDLSRMLG